MMHKHTQKHYLSFFALLFILVGCGQLARADDDIDTLPPTTTQAYTINKGIPNEGRALFNGERQIAAFVPCSTCHYVERHQGVLLGPNMDGLGKRAGNRVPGVTAEEYLYQAIRDPDAYVVDGFPPHTMNQAYDDRLTDEQIDHIIAYLLTL